MLVTQSEYARHRGVTPTAVYDALNAGRIRREANGLIDRERADQDWEQSGSIVPIPPPQPTALELAQAADERIRAGVRRRIASAERQRLVHNAADGTGSTPPEVTAEPSGVPVPEDPLRLDYARARMQREIATARLRELDYQERSGQVMSRKEVEQQVWLQHTRIREHCFHIPARVADQLASETNPARVAEILEQELRLVFENFSTDQVTQ